MNPRHKMIVLPAAGSTTCLMWPLATITLIRCYFGFGALILAKMEYNMKNCAHSRSKEAVNCTQTFLTSCLHKHSPTNHLDSHSRN